MQIQGVAASDRTLTDGLSRTFLVESVIEVKVVNGTYSYTVLPVAAPYLKQYSAPAAEPSFAQRTVAMAWESGELVGCIQLRMNWNGLVAIDDLAVLPHARKQGIGSALLAEAKRWAAHQGHFGLVAETQNTNVPACLLYERAGFVLGGCDSKLYSAIPDHCHEVALFWYWKSPSTPSDA